VGPSAPTGWYAVLSRDAQVTWAIPGGASSTADSVPPGDTISGFILRSTYLPGLTTVEAFPTIESCCQEPLDTADGVFQYALPGGFRATGVSTAPRYIPSEVTLDLLQSQLSAVCDDPLWIDDSSLCSQLADSLDATESRLASSDNVGAGTALDGVLSILDAEREPSGPIEDNAYWLVSLNAAHVLSTIPGGAVTLFATGDTDLRQGTPNQNQGDEDELSIRASGRHRALIQFDSAQIASVTGEIASARLEFEIVVNAENWGTQGRPIDAHRVLVPWTESGATWNCPDDTEPGDPNPDCSGTAWSMSTLNPSPYASTPSGSLLVTGDREGTVSIDVTSDVQAMVAGQVGSYGWIIRKTDEGAAGRIEIGSRDSGTGPRLVIEPGSE
jgi:hypothetical protein